jgi:hypothetical protein
MKKITFILLLALAIIKTNGQLQQTFQKDKFKISCPCKLYAKNLHLKSLDNINLNYPKTSYVCLANENSYDLETNYTIIVYDLSQEYTEKYIDNYYFEERFLFGFENKFVGNLTTCYAKSFHDAKAIQYVVSYVSWPSKALVFILNKKAYILQVGSRDKLDQKFQAFTSSFSVLN